MPDLTPEREAELRRKAEGVLVLPNVYRSNPDLADALAALDAARKERDEAQRRWQAVALKSTDMATTFQEISDLFCKYLGHRVMDETDDDCPHTQLAAALTNLVNAARVKENQAAVERDDWMQKFDGLCWDLHEAQNKIRELQGLPPEKG